MTWRQAMTNQTFFGTLFDTSFSSFITTKFIRVLYVVLILLVAVGSLFGVFGVSTALSEFMPWVIAFVLALPVTAVLFLVYVILARIWLEIIIVVFRMAENIQKMADRSAAGSSGGGGAGPAY
jgi:hypothetical protein